MAYIQKLVILTSIIILLAGKVETATCEVFDLETVVQEVQFRYENTHFFQARFRQHTFLASLDESRESSGKVFIRKPGMMRWEYEIPEKQLLVSDSVNFWIYTPEQNQVIISQFGKAFRSKTPLTFLAGNGNIISDFVVRFQERDKREPKDVNDVYRLSLTPRTLHPSLRELRLEIRKDDFLIVRSTLVDIYGNITDIFFEEIRVDLIPPRAIFTFAVPAGIEVVTLPRIPGVPTN